ncbi:hypothetical protein PMAC_001519 [Pneumocystis sp. 'macacae']|nr:hypothetical protein PMAC_001519 [Pneumocystis sp. 'macacae']
MRVGVFWTRLGRACLPEISPELPRIYPAFTPQKIKFVWGKRKQRGGGRLPRICGRKRKRPTEKAEFVWGNVG